MKKRLLLLIIGVIGLTSCALNNPFDPTKYDFGPPEIPPIFGITDNGIYASTAIYLGDKENGVKYDTSVNKIPYSEYSEYSFSGDHYFTVVATKLSNGQTAQKTVPFTIDRFVYITSIDPDYSSFNVPTDKTISITFNRDLNPAVLGKINLSSDDGTVTYENGTNCSMSISGNTLTLNPDTDLIPARTYSLLMMTNFETSDGIPVSIADYFYSFITAGYLTVTSPNGYESWFLNQTYTIGWASDVGGTVSIELLKNDILDTTISSSTPNDGSFDWTVPAMQPQGVNYKIRVTSLENTHINDQSNSYFYILEPNYLIVSDPNGGETLSNGFDYNIQWVSNMGGNVRIDLHKGGSLSSTLAISTVNDGSFIWTVPGGQTSGTDYRIRITSVETPAELDESDSDFTIIDPFVQVITPNGSETWYNNYTYIIEWTTNLSGNVRIELLKSGSLNRTISSSTPNDGSYSWIIPVSQTEGNDFRIRITSVEVPSETDQSDANFTILNPYITVTVPNGGESWFIGDTYAINWTSNLGKNVRIELIKGGMLSATISAATANDGSFVWTIPSGQEGGSDYLIRITSIEEPGITDQSNANFTIVSPFVLVVYPNGGETWNIGATYTVQWSSNLGGNVSIVLLKSGSQAAILSSSTANDGSFSWTVPGGTAEGGDYTVRVTELAASNSDDSNANFTIADLNKGNFSGKVVDSANNNAIQGATVQVLNSSDVIVDTQTTATDGTFTTAVLSFGNYKFNVFKSGYSPNNTHTGTLVATGTLDVGIIALTMDLPEGELKFFMKWIDEPNDLDFHMTGPTNQNLSGIDGEPAGRYHIWYSGRLKYNEPTGTYGGETFTTALEYDDTGQDRFETMYFKTGAINGVLTVTIHNYSRNYWYKIGGPLPVITVFIGRDAPVPDTEVQIVFPASEPRESGKHYWKVCQVDTANGQAVHVVNEVLGMADDAYTNKQLMDWGNGSVGSLTLKMSKDVGDGNAIFFNGNCPALSNWGTGVQGIWTAGNVWECSISDPGTFEWKVMRGPFGGTGDLWETGANHNQSNLWPAFNGGF